MIFMICGTFVGCFCFVSFSYYIIAKERLELVKATQEAQARLDRATAKAKAAEARAARMTAAESHAKSKQVLPTMAVPIYNEMGRSGATGLGFQPMPTHPETNIPRVQTLPSGIEGRSNQNPIVLSDPALAWTNYTPPSGQLYPISNAQMPVSFLV